MCPAYAVLWDPLCVGRAPLWCPTFLVRVGHDVPDLRGASSGVVPPVGHIVPDTLTLAERRHQSRMPLIMKQLRHESAHPLGFRIVVKFPMPVLLEIDTWDLQLRHDHL